MKPVKHCASILSVTEGMSNDVPGVIGYPTERESTVARKNAGRSLRAHKGLGSTATTTAGVRMEVAGLRRLRVRPLLLAICAVLLFAVPIAVAAGPTPSPAVPGQRVDLKVLLLSQSATDAVPAAWKATLEREGVPYDTYVFGQSPAITDATLADYGAN